MEWKPIETAPTKHSSRFLAYAKPRSETEQMIYEVTRFNDGFGNEIRLNDGYGSPQEWGILRRLSHWMELPDAPKEIV